MAELESINRACLCTYFNGIAQPARGSNRFSACHARMPPAPLPKLLDQTIKQTTFSSLVEQTTTKFAEDREIKAGVGQLQTIG